MARELLRYRPVDDLYQDWLDHIAKLVDDPFWNKKLQDKLVKKARGKTKAPKKPAKKKTDTTELFALNDDESEVELDSLGSFFVHLIDVDPSQDDTETSQADAEEDALTQDESQVVDLKTRPEQQEAETCEADS
nr:uncharacterized protein LOC109778344 [Aegilops tauschii subsp. strangulata]